MQNLTSMKVKNHQLQQEVGAYFTLLQNVKEIGSLYFPGVTKSASSDSLDNLDEDEAPVHEQVNIQDLLPRVDISAQITESLLNEIADKDWKVRNEALMKLTNILQVNSNCNSMI